MTFHNLQTNVTQLGRIGKHLVSKLFEPSIPPKGWQKRILRSAWDLAGRNQLAWLTIRILALFICLLFGLLEQSLSAYLPVLVRIVLFTSLNYGTGILCMVAAVAIAARADGEQAEISAAKAPAAALVLGISKWTIYIILALILIEAGADFARDRRIELSIPDPVEIPAWAVSDYFLNYAAFLFSGILLALPRGGEFLYALLSLTGLSLDDAWQSGRKARRMLGVWIYVQLLALLLAFPVGLEFLGQLLGFEWLRYLAIIWYPFGASLLYCYYREVYMGRTENSPETLKAARPSHVSSETAEVPLRRSFLLPVRCRELSGRPTIIGQLMVESIANANVSEIEITPAMIEEGRAARLGQIARARAAVGTARRDRGAHGLCHPLLCGGRDHSM